MLAYIYPKGKFYEELFLDGSTFCQVSLPPFLPIACLFVFILKDWVTERRRERETARSIRWFNPQMAAKASTKQGATSLFRVFQMGTAAQELRQSSTASSCHKQAAGLEVKLRLKGFPFGSPVPQVADLPPRLHNWFPVFYHVYNLFYINICFSVILKELVQEWRWMDYSVWGKRLKFQNTNFWMFTNSLIV